MKLIICRSTIIDKNEKNKRCKNEDSYVIGRFYLKKNEVDDLNKIAENELLRLPSHDLYVDVKIINDSKVKYYELFKKIDNKDELVDTGEMVIKNLIEKLNEYGIKVNYNSFRNKETDFIGFNKAKEILLDILENYKEMDNYNDIYNLVVNLSDNDWTKVLPKYKIVKFSSSTDILNDEVYISEVEKNIQVNNLFKIAGINIKELIESVENNDNEELASYEDDYKNIVTKRFQEIFRQNDKDFSFRIRIDNENKKFVFMTTDKTSGNKHIPLKNRSDGFKWYFSIYITLYEYLQRDDNTKYILLFDEPNLYLNPSAQNDLLERVFKNEFKNEQIIYTTHSPYMIDAANNNSIKIIEKNEQTIFYNTAAEYLKKLKIGKNAYKNEVDPLTPVLTALHLDISNKLILDKNNKAVVVEGIEDMYILNAMIKKCGYIDMFNNINFIPCFGASKISTMFGYLCGMGYDVYALVDNDNDGFKAIKDIVGNEGNENVLFNTLMTYNIKIDKKAKVLLEDLFSDDDKNKFLTPKNTVLYRDFYTNVDEYELEEKTINNFKYLLDEVIKLVSKK